MQANFDFSHFWAQGDAVSHFIAIVLLVLSVASWAVILGKGWKLWRLRHAAPVAIDSFWHASTLQEGLDRLEPAAPFADLARRGSQAVSHFESHSGSAPHLDSHLSASELVTRALRQGIARTSSHLEGGQTLLASIGSTAPFIGLFGTVWGIYHALVTIGMTGQSSLDKVAGPVGEALIMTAAGLFVAIPAVLAYNTFNRNLRVIGGDLDAFAHDLHTFLTTGHHMAESPVVPQGRSTPATRKLAEVA